MRRQKGSGGLGKVLAGTVARMGSSVRVRVRRSLQQGLLLLLLMFLWEPINIDVVRVVSRRCSGHRGNSQKCFRGLRFLFLATSGAVAVVVVVAMATSRWLFPCLLGVVVHRLVHRALMIDRYDR